MVAAVDGEVGLEGAGFFEGHVGADGGVELGLDVGVGEEDEGEGLDWWRGEDGGGDSGGDAGGSEESKELAAGGHSLMIFRCGYGMENVCRVEFSDEVSGGFAGGGGDSCVGDGVAGALYGPGAGSALCGNGEV